MLTFIKNTLETHLHALRQNASIAGSYAEYMYQDTVGSSRNEQVYCAAIIGTLQRYWELEDKTKTILLPTGKDSICKTCTSGIHCDQEAGYRTEANITYRLSRAIKEHDIAGPYKEKGSKILHTFHVLTIMEVVKSILRAEPNLFN